MSAYTGNKYDDMKTQRSEVPPLHEAESITSCCTCTLQMSQGAARVSGSSRAAESVYYSANARRVPGSGQSRQSSKFKRMRPQLSLGLDFVAIAPIDLFIIEISHAHEYRLVSAMPVGCMSGAPAKNPGETQVEII